MVKEKIRRLIYHKYRNELPINVESLILEIGNHLKCDNIEFAPSASQMRLLLNGMGFRYEKIRGRPQIFESRDLGEKRRKTD